MSEPNKINHESFLPRKFCHLQYLIIACMHMYSKNYTVPVFVAGAEIDLLVAEAPTKSICVLASFALSFFS